MSFNIYSGGKTEKREDNSENGGDDVEIVPPGYDLYPGVDTLRYPKVRCQERKKAFKVNDSISVS